MADAVNLGLSAETAEMSPQFSNMPTQIINSVTYTGLTLTCLNQGPNRAYAAACAPTVSSGTISALACTPTAPAATLNASASIVCTFSYRRDSGSGAATFTGQTGASNDRDGGASLTAGNNQTTQAVPMASLDYGDAPATYGAPYHVIVAGGLRLGANGPDAESGPQHSANALGDDQNGTDDEDGISVFPTLYAGQTSYGIPAANISASGTGTLRAWIDFDKNGVFTASEHASVAVSGGVLAGPLTWSGITVGAAGGSFARLRFTSATLTDLPGTTALDERATDPASNGEVEDHAVTFVQPALPPDASMGVCHQPAAASMTNAVAALWTHNTPAGTLTGEIVSGGLPASNIAGVASLVPGSGLTYTRPSSDFTAYYVGDASLSGAAAAYVAQDYITYSFTTAATLDTGLYLRNFLLHRASASYPTSFPFRTTILLSTDPSFSTAKNVLSSWILTSSGVDDTPLRSADVPVLLAPSTTYHLRAIIHDVAASSGRAFWDDFTILLGSCADRSDAPATYGAADHAGDSSLRLGATRSVDPAPIANADATGDGATDDGVFLGLASGGVSLQGATLTQDQPQVLEFAVTGAGRLSGWLDANRDGFFSPGVETLFSGITDNGPDDENPATGVIRVTITPPVIVGGASFARFRWSSAQGLRATGPAPDGEVEDYAVTLTMRRENGFVLTPDHESTVEAGQLAIYAHRLQVGAGLDGGALSFDIDSEQDLGWIVHRDQGDGVYGAGDVPWVQGSAVPAGEAVFWLVARTPQQAPGGWRDLTRLTASLLKDGTIWTSSVDDLTTIGGGDSGGVFARKLQALDSACDRTPDGGFTDQTLPIAPGGCVIYRILFENRSTDPIHSVRVMEHTPKWMVYVGGSTEVRARPDGLTPLTAIAPANGAEGAVAFPFSGTLLPGEGGVVEFIARLP